MQIIIFVVRFWCRKLACSSVPNEIISLKAALQPIHHIRSFPSPRPPRYPGPEPAADTAHCAPLQHSGCPGGGRTRERSHAAAGQGQVLDQPARQPQVFHAGRGAARAVDDRELAQLPG